MKQRVKARRTQWVAFCLMPAALAGLCGCGRSRTDDRAQPAQADAEQIVRTLLERGGASLVTTDNLPSDAYVRERSRQCLAELETTGWEHFATPKIVYARIRPLTWKGVFQLGVFVLLKRPLKEMQLLDEAGTVVGIVELGSDSFQEPYRNNSILITTRPVPDRWEPFWWRQCSQLLGRELPTLHLTENSLKKALYVRVSDDSNESRLEPVFVDTGPPLLERAKSEIAQYLENGSAGPSRRAAVTQAEQVSEDIAASILDPVGSSFFPNRDVRRQVANEIRAALSRIGKDQGFDLPVAPVAVLWEIPHGTVVSWVWLESGFSVRGFWVRTKTGKTLTFPRAVTWPGSEFERWMFRSILLRPTTVFIVSNAGVQPPTALREYGATEPIVIEQWDSQSVDQMGLVCAGGESVAAYRIIRFNSAP